MIEFFLTKPIVVPYPNSLTLRPDARSVHVSRDAKSCGRRRKQAVSLVRSKKRQKKVRALAALLTVYKQHVFGAAASQVVAGLAAVRAIVRFV